MRRLLNAAAGLAAILAAVAIGPASPALGAPAQGRAVQAGAGAGAQARPAAPARRPGTVVSFAWGGGLASQMTAMPILRQYGMRATYFVPTGLVCLHSQQQCRKTSPYLTYGDVHELLAGGNDVGGLSVLHQPLAGLPAAEAAREVCDDRSTLLRWGARPVVFAYPYGTVTPRLEQLVRQCGYTAGMGTGQLRGAGKCLRCAWTENIPPRNPYDVRTPVEVNSVGTQWTASTYERDIRAAQTHGGGWVVFTIHSICARACPLGTTPQTLRQLLQWLQAEQAKGTLAVRTMAQVLGGRVRPAVAGPRPRPLAAPGVADADLTAAAGNTPRCFQQAVYGQASAIFRYQPGGGPGGHAAEEVATVTKGTGDAKIMPTMDLGECSPSVRAGRRYTAGVWYTASRAAQLEFYYRDAGGSWNYWITSPAFPASSSWRHASWTTPAAPPGATGVSFGLTTRSTSTVHTAEYSFGPARSHQVVIFLGSAAAVLLAAGLITRGQLRYKRYIRAEQAAAEQAAKAAAGSAR